MFSGIVEAVGSVTGVTPCEGGLVFTFDAGPMAADLALGDSVAVDGTCLTVEAAEGTGFTVTAVASTLARTIASDYGVGARVNLERALRVGDRLDGHFVQGHVDGVGQLIEVEGEGATVRMRFAVPPEVAHTTLPRGSITVNGVSLTVAEGPDGHDGAQLTIAVIPYTLAGTNLGELAPGDRVNVEADLIGKYVGRMVASRAPSHPDSDSPQPRSR